MKLRCYSENKTVFLSVFYDLVLRSSSGVSLVNDTTTISVSVYYSSNNELVDFDDSCFTWYKDGYDNVFKTGKSFQLSKSDFASDSLTLKCTFNHPESSYQRSEYITITKASNGYSRAVIQLFKRSASKPANYDGDVLEYTFSTNEISGSTGSWSKTIPPGEYPLYVVYATAFSNASKDSISTGEWTPPAILAEHGIDGSPGPTTFSLVLYQRSASTPSKPTGNVKFNVKSGVVTGAGSWTKDFPNGSDPCWVISATASTYSDSDTIPSSEWSAVQKLVENGKNGEDGKPGANGADAKLIRLSADKTIFSLDSNGKPYTGQVATVTVDKQGIADSHTITGVVSAPANATEFKVTPQMMGLKPIALKQMLSDTINDSSKWSYSGSGTINIENGVLTQTVNTVQYDAIYLNSYGLNYYKNHKYYIAVVNKSTTTSEISFIINLRKNTFTDFYAKYFDLELFAENQRLSFVYESDSDYLDGTFSFGVYQAAAGTTHKFAEPIIVDITDLVSASPKLQAMTDAQLKEWCDTYIPFIEANSTWTIGGKAKNLLDNPTSSDGWTCGTNVTNFSASNGIVTGTSPGTLSDSMRNWIYRPASASLSLNDKIYGKVFSISATSGYRVGFAYYAGAPNTNSYLLTVDSERIANMKNYQYLTASNDNGGDSTTVTIDVTKGVNIFNATEAGWLAQLSLMGIEGDTNVKAWLDTYIPFFEGEMDFPRFPSIEIKATAGSYTDYLTIGTQVQPRTLRLSSSHINIELDAEGHSDEEVTVTAHTQNIYGDLTWSNDRGLPVAKGNEQRFRASQLGLKPIALKQMLSDTFEDSSKWVFESSSGSVANGTLTQTTAVNNYDVVKSSFTMPVSANRKYYISVSLDSVSNVVGRIRMYLRSSNTAISNEHLTYLTSDMVGKRFSGVVTPYETTDAYLYFGLLLTSSSVTAQFSDPIVVDITDLISAYPKLQAMTDAELKAWCNVYIPAIGANSTWTIGGKAKNLELLYWIYHTTPVEGQPGVYQSTSTPTAANPPYARFALSSSDKEGHILCARVSTKRIDGDASFTASVPDGNGWNYSGWGRIYKSFSTEWESYTGGGAIYSGGESQGWIHVYPFYTSSNFPTVNTTFHNRIDNVFNLTSSGWLAQLSLMGIEGADNVKAWIDENVPFFVGEIDFPAYRDVTWTAEYEEVSDSITIRTITSASALPVYIKQTYRAEELVNLRTRPDGTPVVKGDHLRATIVGADGNTYYNVPYTYNGTAWVNMKNATNDNAHEGLMSMLPDILASTQTVPSESAVYGFFQTLIAHDLFAEFISAVAIKVKEAIFGGAYDQNGKNTTGGAGFYLGKDGRFKAVEATLNEAVVESASITNAAITGEIQCKYLKSIADSNYTFPLKSNNATTYYYEFDRVNLDFWNFFKNLGLAGSGMYTSAKGKYRGVSFSGITGKAYNNQSIAVAFNGLRVSGSPPASTNEYLEWTSNAIYVTTLDGDSFSYDDDKYKLVSATEVLGNISSVISKGIYTSTGTVVCNGVSLSASGSSDSDYITITYNGSNLAVFSKGGTSITINILGYYQPDLSVNLTIKANLEGISVKNIYRENASSVIGTPSEPFKEIRAETVWGAVYN